VTTLSELRNLLEASCEGLQEVSIRRMFGCDGFFVRDSIFGLIWKTGRIGIKLADPQLFSEAMSLQGSEPWTAGKRVMSRWVLLPESFHQDPSTLRSWVKLAHSLVLHPPPAKKT